MWLLLQADPESILISESASASFHSDGWNVSHLGDMSYAIDVLFDLDFQKLVSKIWKQKPGILLVVVFSQTSEGLKLFLLILLTQIKKNLVNKSN